MRKIVVSIIFCLFSLNALAQAPEKMSYQAVVRDNTNLLVADKVVGMRISILLGSVTGTAAYVETQSPRSNINGLVTLEIGAGTVVSGSFAGLNWSTGPYFIQTEIDPSGGSNYSILGLSQLVSAPYALYAKTSGSSTPGPTGPIGPVGAMGAPGPTGVAGAAGTNGIAGAVGPQGPKGDTGAAGPAGPSGANGTNGLAGPTGPQGVVGLTGPPGATGPAGANGLPGNNGVAGTNGLDGKTVLSGTSNPTNQGVNGDFYINTTTSTLFGPKASGGWPSVVSLVGPTGANGANGLPGTNGIDGTAGVGGVTTAGTNITLSGSGTVASPYVVSANIPAAAAGTLTGSSLNATVIGSSLTSVGTLSNLTVTNPILGSITGNAATVTTNAPLTGAITSVGNVTSITDGAVSDAKITDMAASKLTGILAVDKGGTGANTLTGLVKGNGASAMIAAIAGTDYQAPLTLTTTGAGAATLAGATLNIPTLASGTATGDMLYWNGTAWVKVSAGKEGQVMLFGDGKPIWSSYNLGAVLGSGVVWNPKTGRIWMDKNLGAINVPSISTDSQGYGSLYQWGRGTDGHEVRTSTTTTTLSTSDTPGNPNFIKNLTNSRDWRSPSNPNLWQGVSGINNPCPFGFRIPTESEWTSEFGTWTSASTTGAFNSVLKLTPAGGRVSYDGVLYDVGTNGYYWSSTIDVVFPADSKLLYFTNQSAIINSARRENGLSVRCIKD